MEVKKVKGPAISHDEAELTLKRLKAKKINIEQFRKGMEVEQEHGAKLGRKTNVTKGSFGKVGRIALAHLKEIPDYYTRLDKMEKQAEHGKKKLHWSQKKTGGKENEKAEMSEAQVNNRELILAAKRGKYWLNTAKGQASGSAQATSASSGGGASMGEESREYLINRIVETTTSGAIGGFPKPMGGFSSDDPALGGRNRFNRKQLKFAVDQLIGVSKKSVRHPLV